MKRNNKRAIAVLSMLAFMAVLFVPAVFAADMTIKGLVSDDGKSLEANGQNYTIAENPKGLKLRGFAGQSVTVKGAVAESEGGMVITVSSYTVEKEARDRD